MIGAGGRSLCDMSLSHELLMFYLVALRGNQPTGQAQRFSPSAAGVVSARIGMFRKPSQRLISAFHNSMHTSWLCDSIHSSVRSVFGWQFDSTAPRPWGTGVDPG